MRPLYLKGIEGTQVDYEVPALTVSVPNKTRQLFPLIRVSRVVVTGPVDWSMPALLACADAGVAVVFLEGTGEVRGQWLGTRRHRRNLIQLFADVLQRADAGDRYQDWLAGMQRMAVRSAARRLAFADWKDADADRLKAWFDASQNRSWDCINRWLQGFLLSSVLQELGSLGLDARSECWRDQRFSLPEEFCSLLFWDFFPALVRWRTRHPAPPDHRAVIVFYENRLPRVEQLLRGIVNKWHRWLLDLC
ncbi:MAG: CRISPR-associated endonuclease Cas1 [Gammaproteobacteria bacterium]